jgi:translation elongation factor P/translation initiation factor 5A
VNELGEVINKLAVKNPDNFNFYGQEIYYLEDNTLKFMNLNTEERYEIKLKGELKFALITDERILTVSKTNQVSLYNYTPPQ